MTSYDDRDDDGDDDRDDFYDDDRSDGELRFHCVLGERCLVADPFHSSDECFDAEWAEAYFAEQALEESPTEPVGEPEALPTPPEDDILLS